jgi:fatty acid amide hydrolase
MDIHTLTARELLSHLERGELSSKEIVDALFDRMEEVDQKINAFVHRFRDQALADAKRLDELRARGEIVGPLHGLPVSVKENVDTKGVPSTLGMKARLGRAATEDAVTVRVVREAGAIVIGKTNVPQTLLSPKETTNFIWGTTNNPWKLSHGPGGSSGGEGAAIASGQSALGIGTDIGGSIRFPAGHCGVVGLKPTLHRWSNVGSRTAIAGQEVVRSQIGPMARTTGDVAMLLRAAESPRHGPYDPNVAPLAIEDPARVDVSKLRIGFFDDDGFFLPGTAMRRAVKQAVEHLRAAGAEVVPFKPPNAAEVVYLFFEAASADGGATLDRALEGERIIEPLELVRRGAKLPPRVRRVAAQAARVMGEDRLARMLDAVGRKPVEDLWAITARRSEYQLAEHRAWNAQELDAVVCPLAPTPAVPQGMSKDFTLSFAYSARYNVLNLPAGVVPVTRVRADETKRAYLHDRLDKRAAAVEAASEGLPVPVQVVGRPYQEHIVLAVMQTIEDAARKRDGFPWTPIDPTEG